MRVYLAGNMHTDWRERVTSRVSGCEFLWPHKAPSRDGPDGGDPNLYFPRDVTLLRSADLVFCLIEAVGRNIGTAAEVGMAYAWGKPVILVNLCPEVHSFQFLEKASTSVCYSIDEGVEVLSFVVSANFRPEADLKAILRLKLLIIPSCWVYNRRRSLPPLRPVPGLREQLDRTQ